jgi:hypothetical protein
MEYSHPENDFDFIVMALHALMIESGFQMDVDNDYNLTIARKSPTFYVIRYRHKLCEEERIRCSLAIMKTDSLVTINGNKFCLFFLNEMIDCFFFRSC